MPFDKNQDKIAITVSRFKLNRSSDGPLGTEHLCSNEPYLITLAVDAHGIAQPILGFNSASYPNVREGDEVKMLGHGHLVYGPGNPGSWVAASVLLLESDGGVRRAGESLEAIIASAAKDAGLRTVLSSNPTALAVSSVLFSVGGLVARVLEANRDDQLLRTQGVFFRDEKVPFCVNRRLTRSNRMAEIDLDVIPLSSASGQGPTAQSLALQA